MVHIWVAAGASPHFLLVDSSLRRLVSFCFFPLRACFVLLLQQIYYYFSLYSDNLMYGCDCSFILPPFHISCRGFSYETEGVHKNGAEAYFESYWPVTTHFRYKDGYARLYLYVVCPFENKCHGVYLRVCRARHPGSGQRLESAQVASELSYNTTSNGSRRIWATTPSALHLQLECSIGGEE